MFKTANVGSLDRMLRIIIGAILIALPYVYTSTIWESAAARWLVPIVGAVLVLTAVFRFCPAYRILGIKTCKVD
ncbi:MAG: hypothetical protein COA52_06675 [Hyphomicrobiales bacterium]|nr:DUF2892 domain-containing protein [Hyphomicrobiales bacterium]PCJ93315.1 MAG: hypothetical protein COA52_06675 [Hyphomicrobiales bacterium]